MSGGLNGVRSKWYTILTGVMAIAVLGSSLMMIKRLLMNIPDEEYINSWEKIHIDFSYASSAAVLLFLLLAVSYLVQAVFRFRESWLLFTGYMVYIITAGIAALLLFKNGGDPGAWDSACFLYLCAVLITRIIAVIRKRSKGNIFLLILMLAFVAFSTLTTFFAEGLPEDIMKQIGLLSGMTIFILVDVQEVGKIVPIAFANIRMDVLKRIIQKTYAAEILFGILLLIVAFSLILPAFEPGIDNFGDALWYCFAIVTTIGFGDIYAVSAVGRLMSVILGIYGIIVVSLITSVIVNFYGEMKKEEANEAETGEKKQAETIEEDTEKG